MKLIVVRDDGSTSEYEDVLDFGVIDKDYVQFIADDYDVELTDKQFNDIANMLQGYEELATNQDVRDTVLEVLGK